TVFLQYSLNGGITWTTLKELYFKNHVYPSYVAVPLHDDARKKVVRIRWWQAQHGGRAHHDWAVDNIFIGGDVDAPEKYLSLEKGHFLRDREWLTATHINHEEYCNSDHKVAVGKSITNENAVLETIDVHVKKHYVLEFMLRAQLNPHLPGGRVRRYLRVNPFKRGDENSIFPFLGIAVAKLPQVVSSRLQDQRFPGLKPNSTEDPPCMGPAAH
ncbi:hypothetical protein AVEN_66952-1, partial [Araneus ventricosus]